MAAAEASAGRPENLVVLVHGTQLMRTELAYARRVRNALWPFGKRWEEAKLWSQPGCPTLRDVRPFREKLEELLGPDFTVRDIPWSGKNTDNERQKATADLAALLDNYGPTRRRVVVAHSHGGNVARDVLLRDGGRGRVDSLVCLSTPFFSARERPRSARSWAGSSPHRSSSSSLCSSRGCSSPSGSASRRPGTR